MRNIILYFLLLSFFGCSKETEEFVTPNNSDEPVKIVLQTNTKTIIANGSSTAQFQVIFLNESNQEIESSNYKIYKHNSILNDNNFKTGEEGEYQFYAESGPLESETINITARKNIDYEEISLPVLFHVVHFGSQVGQGFNFPSSKVEEYIDTLNEGLANQNSSTNPNSVDIKLTIRPAEKDSLDNILAEPGINRINGTSYDDGGEPGDNSATANDFSIDGSEYSRLMEATFWDPRDYLNIWILPTESNPSAIPFAIFQEFAMEGMITVPNGTDGVAPVNYYLMYLKIPSQAGPKVLIHEIGHKFGLKHVFSINSCDTSDYCPDTYSYRKNNFNASCPDNLGMKIKDNYMDYGSPQNTFTYDQRERMRTLIDHGLWISDLKDSNK